MTLIKIALSTLFVVASISFIVAITVITIGCIKEIMDIYKEEGAE